MDLNLADELNPKVDGSADAPPFDGLWRWTECIGCPAALLHRALGCESRHFEAQTLALFYEGILHEKDLKQRIRDKGHLIFEYVDGVRAKDVPVICHADGSFIDGEILETKSFEGAIDPDSFLKSHPQYIKQVMGYERIHQVNRARIIAKNRSNGWILPDIIIEYDPVIIEPIWQNIIQVKHMLDRGVQSCNGPWSPGCSQDFLTRMWCPYNGVHCQRTEAEATSELDGVLSDYARMKPTYDAASVIMAEFREKVEALMQESGVRRIRSQDGVLASIYDRSYTSSDKKLAKEILDDATYHRLFVEGRSPTLRITLPKVKGGDDSTEEEIV